MTDLVTTELIALGEDRLPSLFNAEGAMATAIQQLEAAALAEVMDGSTEEGRKHCTRHKNKVVAAQKLVEEYKKNQTKDLKAQTRSIDSLGKQFYDKCEELKTEIMRPRKEYEEAEAARQKQHIEAIDYIRRLADPLPTNDDKLSLKAYQDNMEKLSALKVDGSFEEFREEAKDALEKSTDYLIKVIAKLKSRIEEAEELAQLRKDKEERDRKEREEQLRKEGEQRAADKLLLEQQQEALLEKQAEAEQPAEPEARPEPIAEQPTATPPVDTEDDRQRAAKNELLSWMKHTIGISHAESRRLIIAIANGEAPHLQIQY